MSGIASILSVIRGGGRPQPQRAYIIPLDVRNGDAALDDQRRYFQYFPETIQDTKQVNWETKNIPGLSHPLYQWISGGAREISFTAVFSRDRVLSEQENAYLGRVVNTPGLVAGQQSLSDPRNLDIPGAVAWLRSFMYPTYQSNSDPTESGKQFHISTSRPKPPSKLLLGLPGLRLGNGQPGGHLDEIVCLMTQCEVSYEGFFEDGTPRLAKVALAFAETIQVNSSIKPVDGQAIRKVGLAGYQYSHTTRDNKTR